VTGQERSLQPHGHTSDCPDKGKGEECADSAGNHTDIFCDGCHEWFTEPQVLRNGSDIAWPSGWTEEQAGRWRKDHHLERPSA
jgi:hypothetical protein